jgi:calcium release-activated calcium channel protein 1
LLVQVALVEFSIDTYPDIPSRDGVFTAYAIVSCLLVSVHLLALLMSMCILPEIKSVVHHKAQWLKHKNEEPLSDVSAYVEIAWVLSTGFGLFLIILELGLVFWIKVAGFSQGAAIAASITLCLIGLPFIIFAVGFYIRIIRTRITLNKNDSEKIERGAVAGVIFMNSIASDTSVTTVNERLSK